MGKKQLQQDKIQFEIANILIYNLDKLLLFSCVCLKYLLFTYQNDGKHRTCDFPFTEMNEDVAKIITGFIAMEISGSKLYIK